MSRPEGTLQDECLDYLKRRGIYHVNTWGNAYERRGRPDIYICYKGKFIGCELKRGSKTSPDSLQLKHLREIEESGGTGVWISSLRELEDLLRSPD